MRYVLIEANSVVGAGDFPIDPNGTLFPQSLVWVPSDTANTGDNYDGTKFTAPIPSPLPLVELAKVALVKSDITMLRCVEAGIQAPTAWNTYRKALRAIATGVDTTSTTLPVQPSYPAGT